METVVNVVELDIVQLVLEDICEWGFNDSIWTIVSIVDYSIFAKVAPLLTARNYLVA